MELLKAFQWFLLYFPNNNRFNGVRHSICFFIVTCNFIFRVSSLHSTCSCPKGQVVYLSISIISNPWIPSIYHILKIFTCRKNNLLKFFYKIRNMLSCLNKKKKKTPPPQKITQQPLQNKKARGLPVFGQNIKTFWRF